MADGSEPEATKEVSSAEGGERPPEAFHRAVVIVLQIVMGVELVAVIARGHWLTALIVLSVMSLTITPFLFRERLPVRVPYDLQFLAVIFVFATLFLGEVRNFYEHIWWWDMALHFASGILLGILGFMLVFIMNHGRTELGLRPNFMALFVFSFALAIGALWEMFEFVVDVMLGTQMQRPMMSDGTGLTDTMWDMILDAAGALLVAIPARRWMLRGEPAVFDAWLERMGRDNPQIFRRRSLGLPRLPLRRRTR